MALQQTGLEHGQVRAIQIHVPRYMIQYETVRALPGN